LIKNENKFAFLKPPSPIQKYTRKKGLAGLANGDLLPNVDDEYFNPISVSTVASWLHL
jgi:hypothetical protein